MNDEHVEQNWIDLRKPFKFIVTCSNYMGEESDIWEVNGSVEDLLKSIGVFQWYDERSEPPIEEVWESFKSINGDGMPQYLIYNATLGKRWL